MCKKKTTTLPSLFSKEVTCINLPSCSDFYRLSTCTVDSSVKLFSNWRGDKRVMNVVFLSQVVRQRGMRFVAGIELRWDRWSASRVPMSPSCLLITKVNHSPSTICLQSPSLHGTSQQNLNYFLVFM